MKIFRSVVFKVAVFKMADELKLKYVVYANFYRMTHADGKNHICRNVADIYDKNYKKSNMNVNLKPQALIIMMNPGECEPLDKNFIIPNMTINELYEASKVEPATLCKPDRAQYQIMRLMDIKRWEQIRILNLSDIKCSNGDEFKKLFKVLLQKDKLNLYSIFSTMRTDEKNNLFQISNNAPVIFGWGVDEILMKLAKECITYAPNGKGIMHSEYLYYYPSPMLKEKKIEWLDKIAMIL